MELEPTEGQARVRRGPIAVERALRDVRVTRIYEGTKIQRIVLARNPIRG